jgi:hypothetical protein
MGNECSSDDVYEIETTVIKCENGTSPNIVKIYCDPMPEIDDSQMDFFILWRNGPDFITLYNKLELAETFRIEYRRHDSVSRELFVAVRTSIYEITDIAPPIVHTVHAKIVGFLNISLEFQRLQDYDEVMVRPHVGIRLLMKKSEKHDMVVGKDYNISYVKFHGKNLYHVESYKPAHKHV